MAEKGGNSSSKATKETQFDMFEDMDKHTEEQLTSSGYQAQEARRREKKIARDRTAASGSSNSKEDSKDKGGSSGSGKK